MVSPLTGAAHGTARRLEREIASFARHLRAANLSPKTIGTYRARILEKMNMQNNPELIRYVVENHLIG